MSTMVSPSQASQAISATMAQCSSWLTRPQRVGELRSCMAAGSSGSGVDARAAAAGGVWVCYFGRETVSIFGHCSICEYNERQSHDCASEEPETAELRPSFQKRDH